MHIPSVFLQTGQRVDSRPAKTCTRYTPLKFKVGSTNGFETSDRTVVCCHEGQQIMVKSKGALAVTMDNGKPQNRRRQEKSLKGRHYDLECR